MDLPAIHLTANVNFLALPASAATQGENPMTLATGKNGLWDKSPTTWRQGKIDSCRERNDSI